LIPKIWDDDILLIASSDHSRMFDLLCLTLLDSISNEIICLLGSYDSEGKSCIRIYKKLMPISNGEKLF